MPRGSFPGDTPRQNGSNGSGHHPLTSWVPLPAALGERALAALRGAAKVCEAKQAADGHWPGDYGGPLFLLPGLIIAFHITGAPLSEYRRKRMLAYLRHAQNADGGFGLHIEGPSTVFGTVLNYIAMRLLGVDADDEDARRARERLLALGGAAGMPTWGKFWLAVLNLYRWEGVLPLSPETWLLPRQLPFHPSRFWCHARAVLLPMSYLYGKRFQAAESDVIRALRQEIFVEAWESIDWPSLRLKVAPSDLYTPHSPVLRATAALLSRYEQRPSRALRRRALRFVLDQIRHEDESTSYLTIGPVSKAIHMLAIWSTDPRSIDFERHLERVDDYLWDAPEGMKMQGYNGSQFWDTAFTMLALLESGLPQSRGEHLDCLRRAHTFLDCNQVRANVDQHRRYFRDSTVGAWPFSTAEQAWPVSDCTAEGIKAALLMAPYVQRPIPGERLHQAVDFLLAQQNPDGGWSEYEKQRGPQWLEWLNAAEVFGDIMIGHSYAECTSACVQGLNTFRRHHPSYRTQAVERAIRRGQRFLLDRQRSDGSWYGGWGICFTYGTWFGIEGLLASGISKDDEAIRRAMHFLLDKQGKDGGWGESYRSCTEKRWVPHEQSQVVQTSWALLGLMAAFRSPWERKAIERGIELLLQRQLPDGSWPQESISAVFNRNCMIHYDNYKVVMPLWALARYHRLFGGERPHTS